MSNREENRVLGRTGARELSPEEVARVAGAGISTITINPFTGDLDGDHK